MTDVESLKQQAAELEARIAAAEVAEREARPLDRIPVEGVEIETEDGHQYPVTLRFTGQALRVRNGLGCWLTDRDDLIIYPARGYTVWSREDRDARVGECRATLEACFAAAGETHPQAGVEAVAKLIGLR